MSCAVCGRDARGYGFQKPGVTDAPRHRACSRMCMDILWLKGGAVFDLTHYEKDGIAAASEAAGAYLEEIGKTDLATMTRDEWLNLLGLVFVRTATTIQRLSDEGAVPF